MHDVSIENAAPGRPESAEFYYYLFYGAPVTTEDKKAELIARMQFALTPAFWKAWFHTNICSVDSIKVESLKASLEDLRCASVVWELAYVIFDDPNPINGSSLSYLKMVVEGMQCRPAVSERSYVIFPVLNSIGEQSFSCVTNFLSYGKGIDHNQSRLFFFLDFGFTELFKSEYDEIIKRICDRYSWLTKKDCYGRTLMLTAYQHGEMEIVRLLHSHGGPLNIRGKCPLVVDAIEKRDTDKIKAILELMHAVDIMRKDQSAPILLCRNSTGLTSLKEPVELDKLNYEERRGLTLASAFYGSCNIPLPDKETLLYELSLKLRTKTYSNWQHMSRLSVWGYALSTGDEKVICTMIDFGANLDSASDPEIDLWPNTDGSNIHPIDIAYLCGYQNIIDLLVAKGSQIQQSHLVHLKIQEGVDEKEIWSLLDQGYSVDDYRKSDELFDFVSIIDDAMCKKYSPELIQALVAKGADTSNLERLVSTAEYRFCFHYLVALPQIESKERALKSLRRLASKVPFVKQEEVPQMVRWIDLLLKQLQTLNVPFAQQSFVEGKNRKMQPEELLAILPEHEARVPMGSPETYLVENFSKIPAVIAYNQKIAIYIREAVGLLGPAI